MENNKRRALGRGLEELFNNNETIDYDQIEEKIVSETPKSEIQEINLNELRSNPYQPRKNFEEEALNELASSIKEHGVFQPIIAKKSIKGYEIIAGERRVRASVLAGKDTIPAIIRDFTDEEMMEIALLENLQRENLNALEEAVAYKKLIEKLEVTQEELAKKLGKSRSHITNMIGLIRLPEIVKDMLISEEITMGHARVLSKIEDNEKILELANKIVNEHLSVRETEEVSLNDDYKRKNINIKQKHEEKEYQDIEDVMCEKIGTKVKIKKNKIEISFTNVNDLNRILEIIGIN